MCGETKRRDARETMIAWLVIGVLALTVAGCARPDWIEQTLVTVDVTGAWEGTFTRVGAYGPGGIQLTLQQGGAKVTGQLTMSFSMLPGTRPIEGTVNGDVFRFRTADGRVTGELQVNGDEMSGSGMAPAGRHNTASVDGRRSYRWPDARPASS